MNFLILPSILLHYPLRDLYRLLYILLEVSIQYHKRNLVLLQVLLQQIEVLVPNVQVQPHPIIHPLSSWLDQQVQLIGSALLLYPFVEEVGEKMGLFLEIEVQEDLCHDAFGVDEEELVAGF